LIEETKTDLRVLLKIMNEKLDVVSAGSVNVKNLLGAVLYHFILEGFGDDEMVHAYDNALLLVNTPRNTPP
jgi:hypothetical protein